MGKMPQEHMRVSGRMAQLLNGEISVADLDDEELARGRCRDMNGGFSGRTPRIVPREMQQEMVRRLLQRGEEMFRESYIDALRVLREIMTDPNNSASDRLKALNMVVERTAGKVPDRIHLAAEDPVETLFRKILSDPDGRLEPVPPPKEAAEF